MASVAIRMIAFFLPLILILFGGNFFIVRSLAKMFASSVSTRAWLAFAVWAATLGFFAVATLSTLVEGPIKYFYIAFAVLLGVWVYVFMSLLASWIVIGIAALLGFALNLKIVALVALATAAIFSAYNIWNAFDVRITHLEVKIKNLPEFWRGKKIVQLSDVHLGHVHGPDFLKKIVEMTNRLHPDAIMITGDLFDGIVGNLNAFPDILNKLEAPEGIYFISGNHETYLGIKRAYGVIAQTKIINLDDNLRKVDGLQIIGKSYESQQEYSSPHLDLFLKSLKDYVPEQPSILLFHVPYPKAIYEARDAGISLMLSGHTHKGQLFPLGLITKWVYKGYDWGLRQDGDFTIYTSSGIGTWGPPMRSGNYPEIVEIILENK